jgi:hypothetical protein
MWLLPFLFVAMGILSSPETLIEFGPGRQSLMSDNQTVRQTARLEVTALRTLCYLAAAASFIVLIWWQRLIASTFFKTIAKQTKPHHLRDVHPRILNASFYVTFASWLAGILYIGFAGYVLPASVTTPIGVSEGYLEQLTAAIFLVCGVIFTRLTWQYRGHGPTRFWLGAFAVVFFVFVGEETSWGQQIFAFQTIELMKGINVQDENNLHNMFGYAADHLFIAGTFVYGVAFPLLCAYHWFWARLFATIGMPIPSLGLALGLLPIVLTHSWTVGTVVEPSVVLRIAELREFLVAIGFLMLTLECRTRFLPVRTSKR